MHMFKTTQKSANLKEAQAPNEDDADIQPPPTATSPGQDKLEKHSAAKTKRTT